ncbi:Phosphoacetylglucosamine Mutase [Blyttiomyces sp. JEL0837]|nr:Phosphoacetylglucosamine Mutase [Blyttiomyces sp. JEL0837]
MFRVGLLAVLRSKSHGGQHIGVMITASHNAAPDNGVKLVEPHGEMLVQSWEVYATELANTQSGPELVEVLKNILVRESIDFAAPARVVVARDTRPSGSALVQALQDGIVALNGVFMDFGIFTTPQLHYVTRCLNTAGTPESYGEPTEEGYYKKLASAFRNIVGNKPRATKLYVDAANGVGAIALKQLAVYLGNTFNYEMVNGDTTSAEKLNHDCGADFVKVKQTSPKGMKLTAGMRACSLDGDADRIVFYYQSDDGKFQLLDGDKIATLSAAFIMDLVAKAKVQVSTKAGKAPLKVGLVQTAYANGSSTAYVKEKLKVPVVFTPTGVKHLHHAAEEFDVGVYFEANGHGTILFSDGAVKAFHESAGSTPEEKEAIATLRSLADLINQAVGDALSDMLLVEAVLICQQKTFAQWNADYTDLPSRQEKVKVANRADFVPIKADTELVAPEGLQGRINEQVAKFNKGRCFVRPSGTEDIVRVYAEAATREETETLANTVCGIVFDHYGGVGAKPAHFNWEIIIPSSDARGPDDLIKAKPRNYALADELLHFFLVLKPGPSAKFADLSLNAIREIAVKHVDIQVSVSVVGSPDVVNADHGEKLLAPPPISPSQSELHLNEELPYPALPPTAFGAKRTRMSGPGLTSMTDSQGKIAQSPTFHRRSTSLRSVSKWSSTEIGPESKRETNPLTVTAIRTSRTQNEDVIFSYAYNPLHPDQQPIITTEYCLFPLRVPIDISRSRNIRFDTAHLSLTVTVQPVLDESLDDSINREMCPMEDFDGPNLFEGLAEEKVHTTELLADDLTASRANLIGRDKSLNIPPNALTVTTIMSTSVDGSLGQNIKSTWMGLLETTATHQIPYTTELRMISGQRGDLLDRKPRESTGRASYVHAVLGGLEVSFKRMWLRLVVTL